MKHKKGGDFIRTDSNHTATVIHDEPKHSLLALINQYNDDELNRSQASATAVKLQHVEIGYFQTLNANFRSTEEEIRK